MASKTEELLELIRTYVDKNLHITSNLFDAYAVRSGRPYYTLDDGWGLTMLATGEPFFVNTSDRNITPWILMGGVWEVNVALPLVSYAGPGMTILDIGAHMGYYTVKLGKKLAGKGTLYAFEPNPEVNAVCLENIKLNGLLNCVQLNKFALGETSGKATLTHSDSNMASANLVGDQDADYSVEVEVRSLDEALPPTTSVDLIKLDAEGYEKRILDGAVATLARSPQCAIMIELGLDRWERNATLDELLPACGGGKEIFAVRSDGMLEKFDLKDVRPFLLTCDFHENYFFIGPERLIEERIGDLVVKKPVVAGKKASAG